MSNVVETKVATGSFAGILTGLVTWCLVAYVPAFRAGLPGPVAALIPVLVTRFSKSMKSAIRRSLSLTLGGF